MKNKEILDCKLNNKTFCECYLKQCYTIEDCAPKLIIRKNMEVVNNLISAKKE